MISQCLAAEFSLGNQLISKRPKIPQEKALVSNPCINIFLRKIFRYNLICKKFSSENIWILLDSISNLYTCKYLSNFDCFCQWTNFTEVASCRGSLLTLNKVQFRFKQSNYQVLLLSYKTRRQGILETYSEPYKITMMEFLRKIRELFAHKAQSQMFYKVLHKLLYILYFINARTCRKTFHITPNSSGTGYVQQSNGHFLHSKFFGSDQQLNILVNKNFPVFAIACSRSVHLNQNISTTESFQTSLDSLYDIMKYIMV